MPKRKFKSGATSRSFKSIGEGLRSGERRIQEQAKRRTDALKLSQYQQSKADDVMLQGLADKSKFEEYSRKEGQKLEQAVRDRQYEALSIKADRDVDRLKGIADEKRKEAEHWAQLAPKMAKAMGQLAQGVHAFSEFQEAKFLNEQRDANGFFNLQDEAQREARQELYKKWLNDQDKVDSPELRREYWRSIRGKDNHAFSNTVLHDLKSNITATKQSIDAHLNEVGIQRGKTTIADDYLDVGYMHLSHIGIDPSSRGGREILNVYRKLGVLEGNRLRNSENAKATESTIGEQIGDISASVNDPIQENILINALAKTIQEGVFEEKGKFTFGMPNIADATQEALRRIIEKNPERFTTTDSVRDFVEGVVIMGKGPTPEKGFGLRHPNRVEELLDDWASGNKRKAVLRNAEIQSTDTSHIAKYDTDLAQHQEFSKKGVDAEGNKYEKSLEEFNLDYVEKALNFVGGSEKSKNYVFERAGLTSSQYSVAGKWHQIQNEILEGDYDKATMIFSGLTQTQRDKLGPQFEYLDAVRKSNYTYDGKNGFVALNRRIKHIYEKSEKVDGMGGKNLSTSGIDSKADFLGNVLKSYHELIPKLGHEGALREAIRLEEEIYKQGVGTDKTEFPPGNNPYNRQIGYFTSVSGETVPQFVYERHMPIEDQAEESKLIRERQKNGNMINASEELRSTKLHEMSTDRVAQWYREGVFDETNFYKNDRFISPHRVKELAEVAENLAKGKSWYEGDTAAVIPPNIRELARLTGESEVDLINKVLAHWYPIEGQEGKSAYRFLQDGQSAEILRNDGEYFRPVTTEQGISGNTIFSALRAQNVTPMRFEVRDVFENGYTPSGAFFKNHSIEVITNEDGHSIFSDPEKLVREGGTRHLSWTQLDSMYGLQSVVRAKMAVKNRKNLSKDPRHTNRGRR